MEPSKSKPKFVRAVTIPALLSLLKTSEKQEPELNEKEKQIEKKQKQEQTRIQIIQELIESERKYQKDFTIIFEYYYEPLSTILSNQESELHLLFPKFKSIFSDLAVIRDYNQIFLSNLEQEFQKNPQNPIIGKLLLNTMKGLKVYTSFIIFYDSKLKNLKEIKNTKLKEYLTLIELTHKKQLQKRNLNDILIHPVKKIPQYLIFIERLIKNTPENSLDFQFLPDALQVCRKTCDFFELQAERNELSKNTMKRIASIYVPPKFSNSIHFSVAHRVLLLEDKVKLSIFDKKSAIYKFFGFNDCFFFLQKQKSIFRSNSNFKYVLKYAIFFTNIIRIDCDIKDTITIFCSVHEIENIKIIGTTKNSFSAFENYLRNQTEFYCKRNNDNNISNSNSDPSLLLRSSSSHNFTTLNQSTTGDGVSVDLTVSGEMKVNLTRSSSETFLNFD